ncbi:MULTISPECIES: YchJ family protein [unclassified Neptuniibacter]|jgi:SEC-C motif-containing protein|uniref:YchJ family protein n=1 Tax=unclassified Neptuniibacter TaxID=2630693 RepID=UPI0026E3F0DC|nr:MULTISPECIES: YchJ family protein [unclassified Neptuniibacter]MDO6512818.1 YchJ family protein [Neptuniibacter sp. 2_MG-2023]MDO6592998.1 YchJ family protein [Neptuniibacter sp. 1_MG-2023]
MSHHQEAMQKPCPCGSNKPFAYCCEPLVQGQKAAPTAEALMRSRYCAFSLGAIDYLIDTTAPEKRGPNDAEILADQVKYTNWTGLKILDTDQGTKSDEIGMVEFEAHFETEDQTGTLYEKSNFRKENGFWVYVDGEVEVKT